MLFSAKVWGRHIEVVDVNENTKETLSDDTDVLLWNGEGHGEINDGLIEIPIINFVGHAHELLRSHGLKVKVTGSCLLTW